MAAPQALTPEQIAQIVAAGRGSTVNIGGLLYGGNWADQGRGEDMQEGPLESITASTGINQVGQPYYEYNPTGVFTREGVTQKVDSNMLPFLLATGGMMFGIPSLGGTGGAGLTTSELAAADMALGGAGGTAGAEALASAAAAGSTGLTASQLANLAKAGINVAGLLGATNAISNMGGNTSTATPITYSGGGAGGYSPEYFSQVQSTYNQLMPGVPRDVATPLQQWYSTEFNPGASVTGSLFGDMTGGTTTGLKPVGVVPAALKPTTPTSIPKVVDKAPTNTPFEVPVGTKLGSPAYEWAVNQGGMTSSDYLNNINQWILDNPNADRALIDTTMDTLGVSDADLQEALRTTTFSDATKYALTHDMSLADVNKNIVDWLAANPTASNAQIQAEQSKYGVSDFDIARALTEQNASAAKEYAIIHDMGLDQYYQNIANAAQSGISAAEAAAQMQQYGVSPADVKQAYSMFAPKAGLTLDEVLAAYNK
jgi:hypothetical protein